ncbi:ceramidase domain-containing protein [Sporomusa sphaeroides]|uniref:ceramidase domain-containing protein n=1 Tax=Sporomusa sphaeroides TaxID=47679 RepID=UPI002CA2C88B|nr:ceramidase domain-containing protein [Sporomusa sphaeroides]HML32117.1 ceramidase domain-containing protein [Sporomusa sphaeroides]
MPNTKSSQLKLCFLLFVVIVSAGSVLNMEPIPQDTNYHLFADTGNQFGVANVNDVISNAGFIVAGMIGLRRIRHWTWSSENNLWRFFFFSIILVGIGSAYYHLQPSNATLVWDRLPMALGFASMTACICGERLGTKIGQSLFLPLTVGGVFSVIYWWTTEQAGVGDLRFYILVQYLSILLILIVLLLYPKPWRQNKFYWLLLSSYIVAKIFELNDAEVFILTHQIISGHTLKHLMAAAGIVLFRPTARAATDSNHNRTIIS